MILDNKINLGFLPTPLQLMARLSEKYPGFNIFIKQDDNTGLASGGNKTRKLEYLIQEALSHNCNTIITAGAQQSNHCRQTAATCAATGLECHLMLGGTEPQKYDGNLLLSHLLGANIHFNGENRKMPISIDKAETHGLSLEEVAMKELATMEGILLDPVYTARAFHGMLDYLKNKKIPSGSKILFWHTG